MSKQFIKHERVWLRSHPTLGEQWVQDRIAEDPGILGLGDLQLRDKERPQPSAGRLDLLLQDPETNKRYEVELQLGRTDESHIIRTIEYWDIERKRYPQYDHCAVIVAEEITSRFLNVISLFNGHIPLVAIQMSALSIGEHLALVFTKVLDEVSLGLVDDDEEVQEPTDRAYWEGRRGAAVLRIVDQLHEVLKRVDPHFGLKYNRHWISPAEDGKARNQVMFFPKKQEVVVSMKLPRSEEVDQKFSQGDLDEVEYMTRKGKYRVRLGAAEAEQHVELLIKQHLGKTDVGGVCLVDTGLPMAAWRPSPS